MSPPLSPDEFRNQVKRGDNSPFYLFYGPDEFRMEKELIYLKENLIPEDLRDLNVEFINADEGINPADIISKARSMPFMAKLRLIVIRRVENIPLKRLEPFEPYLERPSDSTCLILVAQKDVKKKGIFKKFFDKGCAVYFRRLTDRELISWIRAIAHDMGMKMDSQASRLLLEIVGNNPRDIETELEKLSLRFRGQEIGPEQIKETAIHSRLYSIFELMDAVSMKDVRASIKILSKILDEEDERAGALKIMGMLMRQIRHLSKALSILNRGGRKQDLSSATGLTTYYAGRLLKVSSRWNESEILRAVRLLYEADELLKSGHRPRPVLESLILNLSGGGA